jgi:hypothetical protein
MWFVTIWGLRKFQEEQGGHWGGSAVHMQSERTGEFFFDMAGGSGPSTNRKRSFMSKKSGLARGLEGLSATTLALNR